MTAAASQYKLYKRSVLYEMRPYVPGESLTRVHVSQTATANGGPRIGDMIVSMGYRCPGWEYLITREEFAFYTEVEL